MCLLSPDPWNQITPFTPGAFVLWRTNPSHTPDTRERRWFQNKKDPRSPPPLGLSSVPKFCSKKPTARAQPGPPKAPALDSSPCHFGDLVPESCPSLSSSSASYFLCCFPGLAPSLHAGIQCLWAPLSLVGVPTLSLHTTKSLLPVSLRNTCSP